MLIEIGDFVSIQRGTTLLRGQAMGWRVDNAGDIAEIFIDGFYVGFEIGEDYWLILDDEEGEENA